MRKITRCLFFGLFVVLYSCQTDQQQDEAQAHLPADVSLVFSYRPQQLMDKAGYDETMTWPSIQEMLDQTGKENPYLAKILKNPVESGVDLAARFYYAADIEVVENSPKASFSYWLFSIADVDKFEKLWKEMEIPVQPTSNDNRYITEGGETFISWTDTWGIVGTGWKEATKIKLQEIIELKAEQSLAANKNFRKCLAEEADAALWMGSNGLAQNIAAQGFGILANYSEEDLQDNYLHHFLYFDNGLIRTQSKFYIKRKIANDLDLFFRDEVKTNFVTALPAGNLKVVFTAALNPRGINQILIEKYAKRTVQEVIKGQGLSFDDFLEAIDGDMALASYQRDSLEEGLFIARIGKRDKLDALLETAVTNNIATNKGDQRYEIAFKQTVKDTSQEEKPFELHGQLLIKNDLLYMSSSDDLLGKVQNGQLIESGTWQDELLEMSKKNIFALLIPVVQTSLHKRIEIEKVTANANRNTAILQIHLAKKDQNSLYQMMQTIKKEMEERKEENGKKI